MLRDSSQNERSQYKFYRSNRDSKQDIKDYYGNTIKKNAFTIPDDPEWESKRKKIEQIFYKHPFSESIIESWRKIGFQTKELLFKLKGNIKDLVKVRNKMLGNMKRLHNNFFDSGMYKSYTQQDIISFSNI